MTSNEQVCPGFGFIFGPSPKYPTQVVSKFELTVILCKIMANGAAMRCNMTGSITYVHTKGHRACFDNIWLAQKFIAHSAKTTKAIKQMELMATFLNKAGRRYWRETTKWEDARCQWRAAIVIKLAKLLGLLCCFYHLLPSFPGQLSK